jgi:predicted permease
MRGLGRDLKHALRLIARAPGFTTVAVLTLAIGIGASTAVFGLVDALLLRPPPVPHPERVVVPKLSRAQPGQPAQPIPTWSYPKYRTLVETSDIFAELAGFSDTEVNLALDGDAARLRGELVTPSYFRLAGVVPPLGRGFADAAESAPAREIVLGHRFWRERFHGDAGVLGRTVRVDGISLTVIGVAPPGFRGLGGGADFWVPLGMAAELLHPEMLTMRWAHWFEVVGRLRPDVDLAGLEARLAAVGAVVEAAHPSPSPGSTWSATFVPLADARADPRLRTSVLVLFGAVALVLLIGCVNVAHLLLSRSAGRRHEIAVRAALGATRGRLVRQLLTESLLLGALGGAGGLVIALWGIDVLAAVRPEVLERGGIGAGELRELDRLAFSPAVAAFAIGISMLAGIVFGIVPALSTTRVELATRIKESAAGHSRGAGVFVALQLALTLVLLAGAGLLLRSVGRVADVELGIDPDGVIAFQIDPVRADRERPWTEVEDLERRLAALPGVGAVGFDICAPPLGSCDGTGVDLVEGRPPVPEEAQVGVGVHFVNPDHFRALGVPILRGRGILASDRRDAPQVLVINEAAARALFPGEDPIGRRLHAGYGHQGLAEIVGIARDVRYEGPLEPVTPALYVPLLQTTRSSRWVFVRAAGDPLLLAGALRAAVAGFDPELPIFSLQTLAQRARDATSSLRFAAQLLGGFAAVALLLAAVGVYGVMASSVAARRREIGIRMALGARAGTVLGMLLRQGALVAASGVAAGTLAALALSRVLAGLVFGVSVTDPLTHAAVAAGLLALALLSCAAAARRALVVDPAETLRSE